MSSRKMVNHLGKETQGKNKATRKSTCQTELQQLASSSSYVIALWSADVQVRRGKKDRHFCQGDTDLLFSIMFNARCGSSLLQGAPNLECPTLKNVGNIALAAH